MVRLQSPISTQRTTSPVSVDLSPSLQPLLDRLVEDGTELGIQVVVYHQGQLRIDAVAGLADRSPLRTVTHDTLFPVFSVTKGIASTVIHRLADRGVLDYDSPIADLWPEFAAHGKETITLRDALSHAAGIPQMPEETSIEDLTNWDLMCAQIAALTPLWTPSTRIEYHPITFGWMIGEVARRATGKSFGQLLDEEIRQPLGVKEIHVGSNEFIGQPIAVLEDDPEIFAEPVIPPPGTPETVPARFGSLASLMNRPDAQAACVPATSGLMSARAIAQHYAALLDHSLLSTERLQIAAERQKPRNPTEEYPLDRALGYRLGESPTGSLTIGHGGHGGANTYADPTNQIALAVNKNRLNRGESTNLIIEEIYRRLLS